MGTGKRTKPLDPNQLAVKEVLRSQFQDLPTEFEIIWSKCIDSVVQACNYAKALELQIYVCYGSGATYTIPYTAQHCRTIWKYHGMYTTQAVTHTRLQRLTHTQNTATLVPTFNMSVKKPQAMKMHG